MTIRSKKHKRKKSYYYKAATTYLLYTLLFITIFAFLEYYTEFYINTWLLILVSAVLGIISGSSHLRLKNRTGLDDLEDEL